jgi:hypothetical protein
MASPRLSGRAAPLPGKDVAGALGWGLDPTVQRRGGGQGQQGRSWKPQDREQTPIATGNPGQG